MLRAKIIEVGSSLFYSRLNFSDIFF